MAERSFEELLSIPDLQPGPLIDTPAGEHVGRCICGDVTVRFDPADANLPEAEVRAKWPRGRCGTCSCIVYASSLHFVAGDW